MAVRHPRPIEGTDRVVGHTPSGAPLREWLEEYPDGSIRVFREIWHEVAGGSDLIYGGIQVIRTH